MSHWLVCGLNAILPTQRAQLLDLSFQLHFGFRCLITFVLKMPRCPKVPKGTYAKARSDAKAVRQADVTLVLRGAEQTCRTAASYKVMQNMFKAM